MNERLTATASDISEGSGWFARTFSWSFLVHSEDSVNIHGVNTPLDCLDRLDRGPEERALQTRMFVHVTAHFLALLEHSRLR
jgi:hypothetical protein